MLIEVRAHGPIVRFLNFSVKVIRHKDVRRAVEKNLREPCDAPVVLALRRDEAAKLAKGGDRLAEALSSSANGSAAV